MKSTGVYDCLIIPGMSLISNAYIVCAKCLYLNKFAPYAILVCTQTQLHFVRFFPILGALKAASPGTAASPAKMCGGVKGIVSATNGPTTTVCSKY